MALLLALLLGLADPQQQFQKAVQSLASGDLAAAELGFQQVLKVEPNHIGALGNLGVVYSRMGRVPDAVRVYRIALRLDPKDPGLRFNLALAYLKLEDYRSAKPLFAGLAQSSAQARELLATCQVFTGEERQAIPVLEQLPRATGTLYLLGIAYLRSGERAKAEATFRDMLVNPASPAQAHFLMGRAYSESTRFEEAEAEFRAALEADPGLVGARLELGKVHLSTRNDTAAEADFREVLRLRPQDPEACYYLGALLVLARKTGDGIPLLEQAREARPDGWGSYYYLGRAQLDGGRAAAAVPLFEKASQLNPQESAVWYQLARAYQATGRTTDAKRARARLTALKQVSLKEDERVLANKSQE